VNRSSHRPLPAQQISNTQTATYTANIQHTDRYLHSTYPTHRPLPTQHISNTQTATYTAHIKYREEYPFPQLDSNLRLQRVVAATYTLDCTTTGIGRYIFHSFSSLSYGRNKYFFQSKLSTFCDLELPPSNESILSCP
jgi:hypothetical protein